MWAKICIRSIWVDTLARFVQTRMGFLSSGALLILSVSTFAQDAGSLQAPDDVVLQLTTEQDIHRFHVGELIPIKYSYSSKSPGKFFWVEKSERLDGGRPFEISCSAPAEPMTPHPHSADYMTFGQMLIGACPGAGFGGSVGGGCGDCDGAIPISSSSLAFSSPLNIYVRFVKAGTYTCQASSADITNAPPGDEKQTALRVVSNPLELTLIDDARWQHEAAISYGEAYGQLCRGDVIAENRFLQCSDLAQRITYLGTPDSLKTEVKLFDGVVRGWDNGFLDAIQHSSEPGIALELMESRLQDRDFQASKGIIELLAISNLKATVPGAFEVSSPADYHQQAIESLRKYVRLLGGSLSRKDKTVLLENLKTYRWYSEQTYCDGEKLISEEERNQVFESFQ